MPFNRKINTDNRDYFSFTYPARLDKAMHTLEGLVQGMTFDQEVNSRELSSLVQWVGDHMEFASFHPFNEIIPRIQEILADGIVDAEEIADLLWLCNKFRTNSIYYNQVTSDMQRLQGVIAGIIADKRIREIELTELRDWLDRHEHLRTCWPYDEFDALINQTMKDDHISDQEHEMLMEFFSEFTSLPTSRVVGTTDSDDGPALTRTGICAIAPEIVIPERAFCLTGQSSRCTRKELKALLEQKGAKVTSNVVKDLNYLVIGSEGNECWAYACYGRKVEQAMTLRRNGAQLLIVHEFDLWDAIEDS